MKMPKYFYFRIHVKGLKGVELENASDVDVVEVVRCRDCKHYVIHTVFGRSQGWCERLCDAFDRSRPMATELDDYCSRAEPYKEGDAK